jgi:hypothetical protein
MPAKKPTVSSFLNSIEDREKRSDAKKIAAMMRRATGKKAVMHGSNIVGFGSYHYKYASGREGDAALVAFSPRGRAFSIYIMPGFKPFTPLMKKLGKHRHGASCLYVNGLSDVDEKVLEKLIVESVRLMRQRYDTS